MYTWILVFFTVFLKNRNIRSKIKRSKVTGYAALRKFQNNQVTIMISYAKYKSKASVLESSTGFSMMILEPAQASIWREKEITRKFQIIPETIMIMHFLFLDD